MANERGKPELILALDVPTEAKALALVDELDSAVSVYKVGLQLFTAAGPSIITELGRRGARVFLDLKLYDIPNTVSQAVRQAVRHNVFMLTMHTAGGMEMMRAAANAALEESRLAAVHRPLLIGVTVLTSREASQSEVAALARLAVSSGLDGVVSSAQEASQIRKALGDGCYIVTPGIRQEQEAVHDQKRTATVADAVRAGSDFLVVGRPILEADNPRNAAQSFVREIERAYQCYY
jgi:orotidine-5'-phosphate decarboxylase